MRKKLKELHGRKFVRDALVLQLATFFQAGSYLATSVLTTRLLGMHEKGRWDTTRDIFGALYFFVTMGLVTAALTRYAEAMGRKDRAGCTLALAAMVKLGLSAAAIVTAAAFVLAPRFTGYQYDDRQVGFYAAILCAAGVFEIVRGLAVVALMGTRQMRAYAAFDITSSVIRFALVVAVLVAGWGVQGVVAAFVVHMVIAGAIALRFYERVKLERPELAPPPLREVIAAVPSASMHHIFGISYLMALNKGLNTLLPLLAGLIIPGLAALQSTGEAFSQTSAFKIAYVLSWGLGLAMTGVSQSLLPALGLKLGRTDTPFEQMGGLLKRVSLTAGFLMVGATLVSIPVMWVVVTYFYGPEAHDAFTYYCILTTGNLFLGFNTVIDAFWIYSGRLKLAVRINLVLGAVAVGTIFLGAKLAGPIGIAAAVGLCDALGLIHLVYMWLYFRRAKAKNAPLTSTPDLSHD